MGRPATSTCPHVPTRPPTLSSALPASLLEAFVLQHPASAARRCLQIPSSVRLLLGHPTSVHLQAWSSLSLGERTGLGSPVCRTPRPTFYTGSQASCPHGGGIGSAFRMFRIPVSSYVWKIMEKKTLSLPEGPGPNI